jgi:pimeloyl-ACP methyl ester carboxylesterase
LSSPEVPEPSRRTLQVLRQYDLSEAAEEDREKALAVLQGYLQQDPTPDGYYAFAEMAYLAGKELELKDKPAALEMYENAVAHAYLYLFDERLNRFRNPYDPQFRGACDVYNGALDRSLRILAEKGALVPGKTHTIEACKQTWDVTVVARGNAWHPEDFGKFEFVSDYEVTGLENLYQTYGLGVPLIAVRNASEAHTPTERFYPPGLSFPVTAFLRVVPDEGTGARRQAVVELCDPLTESSLWVGRQPVPLESDLSTPLAYFLNNPELSQVATAGLLLPDLANQARGLYMVHPYEPGKIPVVLVHGLWSSPLTWSEMFNDLLGRPELRERFQFWFYLYPSGQPFWISAAQFRHDLAQIRVTLDPQLREPAMDQMVLVGHSMGGLVSMLQTLESGDDFWRIVSDRSFEEVKATPELREGLRSVLYFHPNPSIRRVITIGTPHRGSQFASGPARYLGKKLISVPKMLMEGQQQLYKDNRDVFRDMTLLNVTTSFDSLSPDSPILPVMLAARRPPVVHYHNIVGVIEGSRIVDKVSGKGDGLVSYESAHVDFAESELVVNADHVHVHSHPLSVLEVRRILLEHAAEYDRMLDTWHMPRYQAAVPGELMFGSPPLPHR